MDVTACFLDQLRKAIQVSTGSVIVDGNNRVVVFFDQPANRICGPLLHFRVGALYGIELDGSAEFAGVRTGHGGPAHPDPVVVTSHHQNAISF